MTDETEVRADKLDSRNRADYLKAKGYDVTLKVQYTRVRRVRALNKAQAKEFAIAREEKFSKRYFNSQNLRDYHVDSVRSTKVEEMVRDESVVE